MRLYTCIDLANYLCAVRFLTSVWRAISLSSISQFIYLMLPSQLFTPCFCSTENYFTIFRWWNLPTPPNTHSNSWFHPYIPSHVMFIINFPLCFVFLVPWVDAPPAKKFRNGQWWNFPKFSHLYILFTYHMFIPMNYVRYQCTRICYIRSIYTSPTHKLFVSMGTG